MPPLLPQIETIFSKALEIPPADRAAFLESACGGDSELRREVDSLLRHMPEQTADIEAAIQPVAAHLLSGSPDEGRMPPQMGRYRLERKLGEGGMGAVYLATDSSLQRSVAIKVISRAIAGSEEARARFLREARSAAALCHRNIATLYDVGEEGEALWLVMEYVKGDSLRTYLTAPLDEPTWLDLSRQMSAALEHAHERRIIHRDIKPENILIGEDGVLKIIDFGLARAMHDDLAGTITAPDAFIGTLAYAAPEVLTGSAASPRSDIYSAGVVVYEMAYGVHPFGRDKGQALIARILGGEYTRQRRLPLAAGLTDRCLARDPAGRFKNGGEFAAALRNLGSQTVVEVSPQPPILAVMNFRNIGGAADSDWLSAGIAETLSADLAKLKSVRVASRARVMASLQRLGKQSDDPALALELGRDLGAHWVVSGSYQRFGARIRVTAALIDCDSGESLATEKVDGAWEEIFDVQDRVVAALLKTLTIGFGTTDAQKILPAETRNLMAYEHYVRGRQAMYVMEPASLSAAIGHFEKAVALDSDYALAYSGLGTAHALLFISTSNPDDIARASRYLERAIELDPELGEPYPWLNNIRARRNDIAGALAAGRKAVELQPDLPEAHYFYGGVHYMMPEMAVDAVWTGALHVAEAIRLQPKFHAGWLALGAMANFVGKHSESQEILRTAIRMESEPDLIYRFTGARTLLAVALTRMGEWQEARDCYQDAVESLQTTNHVYTTCFQVLSWHGLGEVELRCGNPATALTHFRRARRTISESRRIVGSARLMVRVDAGLAAAYAAVGELDRAAELIDTCTRSMGPPALLPQNMTFECSVAQLWFDLAVAAAGLGHVDEASSYVSRAYDAGWSDPTWLRNDPSLRAIGGHVVFEAVVAKLASKTDRVFPRPV